MSTAYTTEAAVKLELGSLLIDDLLDLDEDDAPDTGSMDARIDDAGSEIDSYLSTLWAVPFAAAPGTPDVIALIAKYIVCANILRPRHELSKQREEYMAQKDAMLTALKDGQAEIPGVAKLTADKRDGMGIASNTPPRVFSGVDSDDLDPTRYM